MSESPLRWLRECSALVLLGATAATAAVDHYDVADGLSQNSVVAIERDARGFLWLGTEDGLNRFDGEEFRVHRADFDRGGMPDGFVQRLARSGEVLWIGTIGGGLARMHLREERIESLASAGTVGGPATGSIQALLALSAETALIGTPQALYQVQWPHNAAASVTALPLGEGVQQPGVRTLASDGGRLLVGSEAGACMLSLARMEDCERIAAVPPALVLAAIHWRGAYWLSVDGLGLLAIDADGQKLAQLRFDHELPTGVARILALLPAADGGLWLGSDQGAYPLKAACLAQLIGSGRPVAACVGDRVDELDPDAGRERKLVYSLLGDEAGGLWIGAWNHGLERYDPRRQAISRHRVRLPGRSAAEVRAVRAIAPVADGLWLGSYGGGVVWAQPSGTGFAYQQPTELIPGTVAEGLIWALLADEQSVWIGSDAGLSRWQPGTRQLTRIQTRIDGQLRPLSAVRTLHRDRAHRIWIGGERGLLRIDDTDVAEPVALESLTLPDRRVFALEEDPQDGMLIGTWSGVYRLSADGQRVEPVAPEARLRVVWDLAARSGGGFWVGSSDGLVEVEADGRWRRYTEAQGLANRVIYGIEPDDEGLLWLSSNHGVMRLDPRSGAVINFGASDPLQHVEFMYGSHARDAAGRIYFGGSRGYNRIDPARVAIGDQPPLPLLTAVLIDGQALLAGDPRGHPAVAAPSLQGLRLQPSDSVVELRYGALAHDQPGEIGFRYRLRGFDLRWQAVGSRRFASYTNLPPGQYQFEVEAISRFGQVSAQPRLLAIEVLPPWYQTWPVRLAAGLLVVGTGWLLLQRRLQRLERHRRELEGQVRERTLEIASQRDELAAQQAELQRVNAELAAQSLRDSLTGLPNRRALLQRLAQAQAQLRETGTVVCLALVDLDHFKRINDRHGHAAGDAALMHLAALWPGRLPAGSSFGRLGGEEFLLLFVGLELPAAQRCCEDLLQALRQQPVPWKAPTARQYRQPPAADGAEADGLALRASIGLVQLQPGWSGETAMARADRALYAAKESGRDRLVVT